MIDDDPNQGSLLPDMHIQIQGSLLPPTPPPDSSNLIGGIDGGMNGAIVLLGPENMPIKIVMPIIKVKKNRGTGFKRHYNEPALRSILVNYRPFHVYLEAAQAMPPAAYDEESRHQGQGVVSAFNTGFGHGLIRGLLAGLQIPYTIVHPRTWQAVMLRDVPKGDTKKMAFVICSRLWPAVNWCASDRAIIHHDGLCDAALIAAYGRRQLNNP